MNSKWERIYKPDEISEVIDNYISEDQLVYDKARKRYYYNIPCSFDIETSSFKLFGIKYGIMYIWMLGINDAVIIGRTWDEFKEVIKTIQERLELSKDKKLIIYIHNLEYEFQFMRKHFKWDDVFAMDDRKPLKADMDPGIELRCSYLLSGKSLAEVGADLIKYPIAKMVGDLDYSLIRHSKTPLTHKELGYCINDVKVVMNYIRELSENEGDITHIPLTKTGFVRRKVKRATVGNNFPKWRAKMSRMTLTQSLYEMLSRAFIGGFTHANAYYVGLTMENVHSFDFTSSYPYVMVSEMFPMDSGEEIIIKSAAEFRENIARYCCLMDITFINIHPRVDSDNPISYHKCYELEDFTINNGRVVSAARLTITITEQDFIVYKKFYKWDNAIIRRFVRFKKTYLPTEFVSTVLDMYQKKTELKGVEGKEYEYQLEKGNINATYGMCVMDIAKDKYIYTDDWKVEEANCEKEVSRYNNNKNRFICYPWGIWIAAYARKNLFTGIYEFGDDYIYSDTDSIKVKNLEKHKKYIENYNKMVEEKLRRACAYHKIDFNLTRPKTKKGIEKPLGIWDYEGEYKYFKTLGAKRYLTLSTDNVLTLTVAGLNKGVCTPYLCKKNNVDFKKITEKIVIMESEAQKIFDDFNDELDIPGEFTGKLNHTYIDEVQKGKVTDYLGVEYEFEELSSVHMEPSEYSFDSLVSFLNYCEKLRRKEHLKGEN